MLDSEKNLLTKKAADVDCDSVQLSEEDLLRVEKYLSSPVNSVERKPFRPWLMMLGLVGVITSLSLLSVLISYIVL